MLAGLLPFTNTVHARMRRDETRRDETRLTDETDFDSFDLMDSCCFILIEHCIKRVCIRSFSGLFCPAFGRKCGDLLE